MRLILLVSAIKGNWARNSVSGPVELIKLARVDWRAILFEFVPQIGWQSEIPFTWRTEREVFPTLSKEKV
jgi:hypothetical protein